MANGHDPSKPPPNPGSGTGTAPGTGTGPKTATGPKTGTGTETGTGTGGVTPLDSHKPPQKAMGLAAAVGGLLGGVFGGLLRSGMHH